ncbi:oligosaccharide flippase family protein [Flagellimonas sp. HMM57]|uniref:lipopolysaccharide biosynthesis protein n=1 Tax=unclassified Flagellimonas TaxID=2644544 RepID=UPI0013D05571|nr:MULTISPECIES: oligosaccharide flippase family protein [unclassified Flagellimonas]UII76120.1 oligosaccharide flippase family protein [Flagellimonas sp. HMM57]
MGVNQLKGGAALSYFNIILTNILGLLMTPYIINSLGNSEYGLYTMIGALVGYLSVLDFGLNNTIIRFVAKYRAEKNRKDEENFLAHSFIIYAVISTIIAIIGIILLPQLGNIYDESLNFEELEKAKTMFVILIFNLCISLPGGAFGGICSGYEEFILPKIIGIIKYVVRALLIFLILYQGGDSISMVILDTVLNLIIIAVNLFIVFKKLNVSIKLHSFQRKLFRKILGFSIWLFVFALVHQLRWQFGQLILGVYFTTTVVAIYAVGITLGNYYGAFSSAIESVFLPRAMQMTVQNRKTKELTDMFIKISRIILLVLLFILGEFILIGRDFVHFWVGNEFSPAYYYALIIMIGLTPTLSQGFANNILEAKNFLSYRGRLILILTILGVLASIYVAKNYGVVEMILVTVFFIFLERIIMIPYYIRKADLDMLRYYREISPLFLGLLGLLSIFLLINYFLPNDNLYIVLGNVLCFGIAYLILFYYLMTAYEKDLFKSLIEKTGIKLSN